MSSNISPSTTIAYVNSGLGSRTLVLPSSSNISGKYITIKDGAGQAFLNTITIQTSSGDVFENGGNVQRITVGGGFATYFVRGNTWFAISDNNSATGGIDNSISSLSSIISYGLSSISAGGSSGSSSNLAPGLSSLSSIVSYGLSSIASQSGSNLIPGISSLSSVVSYGLSSLNTRIDGLSNANVYITISSFSSILSYGLSSINQGPGISSLSSIVSYGLSSLGGQTAPGISSLSSVVSYGLSSLRADTGISSLSTVVSYGLSSIMNVIDNFSSNFYTSNLYTSNVYTSNIFISATQNSVFDNLIAGESFPSAYVQIFSNDNLLLRSPSQGQVTSIYNNGSIIVGGGNSTLVFSVDGGVTWNNAANNPFENGQIHWVKYDNYTWVVVGSGGENGINLAYSFDGIHWSQGGTNEVAKSDGSYPTQYGAITSICFNSNGGGYWMATAYPVYMFRSNTWDSARARYIDITELYRESALFRINSLEQTAPYRGALSDNGQFNGFYTVANGVVNTPNSLIATGYDSITNFNIQVSKDDGSTWAPAQNQTNSTTFFFLGTGGTSLAYGNGTTLVGGGSNELYRSVDDVNFYNIFVNFGTNPDIIPGYPGLSSTDILSNYLLNDWRIYDIKYKNSDTFYINFQIVQSPSQVYSVSNIILKSVDAGNTWSNVQGQVSDTSLTRLSIGLEATNIIPTVSGGQTVNLYNSFYYPTFEAINVYARSFNGSTITITNNAILQNITNTVLNTSNINAQNIFTSSLSSQTVFANNFFGDGSGLINVPNGGVSSLSSIVSYGLSSLQAQPNPGLSSLSSIVSYGLSTIRAQPNPGLSSLSSIVSYGLSTIRSQPNPGLSSLSSIVSYGLSTIRSQPNPGLSSLSSIVSYGLSTLQAQPNPGLSSLSSIVSYGLSSLRTDIGISSLSSIVSYGLSSLIAAPGISSLSSIISYGLSTVAAQPNQGTSSLSSIVSYGLSSIASQPNPGISSLSSIVSYGLSSLRTDIGISSLSSLVSYGLSSIASQPNPGISSLSSIISYGLSSLGGLVSPGISSLSSIVSYGLSSVRVDPGVSSLSSIVSYGLSSLGGLVAPGISSLSSIVSYGLSSLRAAPGISSLSSVVSYGLSSIASQPNPGISSLSSVVSFGLSSVFNSVSSIYRNLTGPSVVFANGTTTNIYARGSILTTGSPLYGKKAYYYEYNNRTWVAGVEGDTSNSLFYSYDGFTWNRSILQNSPTNGVINYLTYQNNLWVGLMKTSNTKIIYSSDGVTWQQNMNVSFSNNLYGVTYGLNKWVVIGNEQVVGTRTTSIYSTTDITGGSFVPANSGGFLNNLGKAVSYNNGVWLAIGYDDIFRNIQYSTDGANWLAASNGSYFINNTTFFLGDGGGTTITYNSTASRWIVGGNKGLTPGADSALFQSTDASNFFAISTADTSNINTIYKLTYDNAGAYYAIAQLSNASQVLISSSNNCSNWSIISPISFDIVTQRGAAAGLTPYTYVTADVYNNTIRTSTIFANTFYGDGSALTGIAVGVSSLSTVVSLGLSSLYSPGGISSLSSVVSYGLSSLLDKINSLDNSAVAGGLSSLSSVISYGLSSINASSGSNIIPGVSSLSSIVSYGLSSLAAASGAGPGVSSLSSVVSYGLSTLNTAINSKIASLSNASLADSISSLSSVVSYGLSSLITFGGISSLSSVVSYGLSSLRSGVAVIPGVSSLSSIVSYGLSSLRTDIGVSSLSSIVSYGLSSVATNGSGLSSLSSVVSYGLSTVYNDDKLRYDTYNAGFNLYNKGGTGIKDKSTGDPDTYTNGLAKIDEWIYKNIVDQPPALQSNTVAQTITSVAFGWSNFFQFKIGILNLYAPFVSSLRVNLYSNTTNIQTGPAYLFSTFTFSSNYLPFATSNFEAIEFNNCNSQFTKYYTNPQIPNKKTFAIGIDSTVFNQINQPFAASVYYENYSSNAPNVLYFSGLDLGFVDVPSAPFPSLLTPTISNITLRIVRPIYISLPVSTDYPLISQYSIVLCNVSSNGYPRRYGNIPSAYPSLVSNVILPYTVSPVSYIFNNLAADSIYISYVAAKNSINPSYSSNGVTTTCNTSLPVAPGTITNIFSDTINPTFYTTVGQVVFDITRTNLSVYNSSNLSNGLSFTTNPFLGIHSSSNPGVSDGQPIGRFSMITSLESNTRTIFGFGSYLSFPTQTSNVGTYTRVFASNINDFYPTDVIQSNFFMSFTGRGTLLSNFLLPASNSYTFSFTHSNSAFNNTNLAYTPQIWVDDLRSAPSLAGFSNTSNTYAIYVSGVPVYSYSNTITFNIDVANMARYFFITGQNLLTGALRFGTTSLLTLSCNTSATFFDINNNIQSRAPISNISRFIFTRTFTESAFYTSGVGGAGTSYVNMNNVQLSNLVNPTGVTASSNSGIYMDGPSQVVLETLMNSVGSLGGLRVFSDGGSNAAVPATLYDNTQLIISNTVVPAYSNELPIVNGLFRTGVALGSVFNVINTFQPPSTYAATVYSRLSNYRSISNETGRARFATFKYTLSNSATSNVVRLLLNFNSWSGLNCNVGQNPYNVLAVPYLQYRIDNIGTFNTGWLDANTARPVVTPLSNTPANVPGLLSNQFAITSNTRVVSLVPIPPQCNYDVYVKIGLTTNCNITFQTIRLTPQANSLPPRVTGVLVATAPTCNLTMTWTTPVNCNSPLDYYAFSIAACNSDSTYPRRFVPGGGATVVQEPNMLGNTCNSVVGQTSFTYSATYSNFDTYYTGSIALANDVGLGPSSNTNTVRTVLPNNPNVSFSNGSNFDLTNKTLFPYSVGYNFSRRGLGLLSNIIVSMGSAAIFDYLYVGARSNLFSVNDSTTTGSAITGFIYTGAWVQGGSATPVASAAYAFGTSAYSYSNTTSNASATNGSLTLNVQNIQDTYTNGPARGFFAKAYANISLASLPAGSNSNVLTLSNTGLPLLRTAGLWVDDTPNIQPTINSITPDTSQYSSASYCNFVCGVISMANSNVHPFFIEACNIGSYFFRDKPITVNLYSNVSASGTLLCNFSFDSAITKFYGSRSTASEYILAPISNSSYFLWSNSLSYQLYTPCNIGSFNGTACNLYFNAATPGVFVYGGSNKSFYYDTLSITVRDNTLNSNWFPTSVAYGIRVESGGAVQYPAIGSFGADFNNTCNIRVGVYSNELQLVYGAYRTFCNATNVGRTNGYLDYGQFFNPFSGYSYPDYSPIGVTGKRYLTTKYSFSATVNSSNWKSANIRFIYGDAPFTYDALTFLGIDILYKIVASNDSSATTTNLTTGWLNANSIGSIPPDSTTKNTDGTAVAFSYAGIASDSNNTKVFFPNLNYSNVNFSVYVRVGIPMNCNVSLQYVDFTPLTLGASPGNLSNLYLSNAQTLPLTNSFMSWWRQNDSIPITNYLIRYAAIQSNTGTILYPRRYLNTVISDSGFSNSNVETVPTSQLQFSYTFTPSNYDTYYSGTVQASNVSGTSVILSNNSINRTPLPSNIGNDLASGVGLCNTNYTNIVYSRTGTIFNTTTTVPGSLIYNSNVFFQGGGVSPPFQIYSSAGFYSNITVNPINGTIGSGLNTAQWSITLLSNGTQFATQSYSFPYSVYSLATNTQIVNNSIWSWSNISNADMYVNDMYRSNFYAITTPKIWLKTAGIQPGVSNRLYITDTVRGLSNVVNFYVEQQNVAPTGSITLVNDSNINFLNICGISVIASTTFNFWINVSNIGTYFYFNPPAMASLSNTGSSGISNFIFNSANTQFYSGQNLASVITNPPLPNSVYFYWSNVGITNSNFGQNYTLGGTTSNLVGQSAITGLFTPYYDFASIAMLTCNVRVESGNTPSITEIPVSGSFGTLYNNDISITTSLPYNAELQLANGGYFTPRNVNSFKNYTGYFQPNRPGISVTPPDYSGANTGAMRYGTFLFGGLATANVSNKVDTVTYRLNWVNGFTPTLTGVATSSSTNTNSFFFNPTDFQMRIRFNSSTPGASNDSSEWLNMNSNRGSVISIYEKSSNAVFCTSNISNYYSGSNLTFTVKVPDGCGYNSFSNYLRVGLSAAGYTNGLGFSNIQYIGQTEFNVPSRFSYSCNTGGTTTTTTSIVLNLIQGLPTNTYYRLSNELYYSNAGNVYNLSNTSNIFIDPTIANYTVARTTVFGFYSNRSIIYKPDNSIFWQSNYIFNMFRSNVRPALSDFQVTIPGPSAPFQMAFIVSLTNPPFVGVPTPTLYTYNWTVYASGYWDPGRAYGQGSGSNLIIDGTRIEIRTTSGPSVPYAATQNNVEFNAYITNTVGNSPISNWRYTIQDTNPSYPGPPPPAPGQADYPVSGSGATYTVTAANIASGTGRTGISIISATVTGYSGPGSYRVQSFTTSSAVFERVGGIPGSTFTGSVRYSYTQ